MTGRRSVRSSPAQQAIRVEPIRLLLSIRKWSLPGLRIRSSEAQPVTTIHPQLTSLLRARMPAFR